MVAKNSPYTYVDNDIAILLKNWSDVIRYGSNYCQIRIGLYFSKMCL